MYAVLEQRPGDLYDVAYFSDLPPAKRNSLFTRPHSKTGQSERRQPGRCPLWHRAAVCRTGLGAGRRGRRGMRGGMQNTMHARIAVGADRSTVLTGYTWSDIAIGLE